MNIYEMKAYLKAHGIEDGFLYTHGGLGNGDIDGIEQIDGKWYTYFSERGSKSNYQEWDNEESATRYIIERAEKVARRFNLWKE